MSECCKWCKSTNLIHVCNTRIRVGEKTFNPKERIGETNFPKIDDYYTVEALFICVDCGKASLIKYED